MFAATPFWLWPVLWWSLGRHQAWLRRFWAEHGYREVLIGITHFGTIRILHIGDRQDLGDAGPHISKASFVALAYAMRPPLLISQPVRTSACAFARRADARAGASGRWCQAAPKRPVSLAPG